MLNNLNQPKGSTIGMLKDGRTVEEAINTISSNLETVGASIPQLKWLTPGQDIQSEIDSISSGSIGLSAGVFSGDIQLKSGVSLVGSGRPTYDKASGLWSPGTLIVGRVSATDANGFMLADLGVDCTEQGGNAVSGMSPLTGNGIVSNVATRANNHGQLWEAQDDNPDNTNCIGNIKVLDCIHYGGPNGFVTKHKRVSFIRCESRDVTIQGFVVVSDNINGADKFSRATDTVIRDCSHFGDATGLPNNEGLRIYSREYSTSAGRVKGVDGVLVDNFNGVGCAGAVVRTGENAATPSGFSKVITTRVSLLNLPFNTTKYAGKQLDSLNGLYVDGCRFGNKANVDMKNNSVDNVRFGVNMFPAGTTTVGVEAGRLVVTDNGTTLLPRYGQRVIDIQNTQATTVTSISYGTVGVEHYILINDTVTTVSIGGRSFTGKGSTIHVRNIEGNTWIVLGSHLQ